MAFEHTEDPGRLVLGFLCMFCASTIASAGGIGGGGVIGGILLVIMDFSWSNAVILALAAVAGSTIAQVTVNIQKRHPFDQTRPVIYFDAILTLLPAQLGGAAVGVIIMPAFPSSILVVLGTIVLVAAGLKLLVKGCSLWIQESAVRDAAAAAAAGPQYGDDLRHSLQQELERERAEDAAITGVVKIHSTRLALEQANEPSHVRALSFARSLSADSKDRRSEGDATATDNGSGTGQAAPASMIGHFSALGAVEVDGDEGLSAEQRSRVASGALTSQDGRFYLTAPAAVDSQEQEQEQEQSVRKDLQHLHDFQMDAIVLGMAPGPNRNEGSAAGTAGTAARITENPIAKMSIAEPGSGRISVNTAASLLEGTQEEGHSMARSASVSALRDLAVVTAENYKLPDIRYPWLIMLVLLNLWLVYAICILIAKTKEISPECSSTFFLIMGCAAAPLVGAIAWGVLHVANRQFLHPETVLLGDLDFAGVRSPPPQVGQSNSKAIEKGTATLMGTGGVEWGRGGGTGEAAGLSSSGDDYIKLENAADSVSLSAATRPRGLAVVCKACLPPAAAFFIGVMCSLLGIGGGELMGPLMLAMGILPQVSSATTSFMSLASSMLNLIHYGIDGQLNIRWAVYCYAIGLFGGITGRKVSIYIVDTFGRPSINVFMLGVVLFLSVILLVDELAEGADNNYSTWAKVCDV